MLCCAVLRQVPELVVRARASLQSGNSELLATDGQHELLRIVHGNALSGGADEMQQQD